MNNSTQRDKVCCNCTAEHIEKGQIRATSPSISASAPFLHKLSLSYNPADVRSSQYLSISTVFYMQLEGGSGEGRKGGGGTGREVGGT